MSTVIPRRAVIAVLCLFLTLAIPGWGAGEDGIAAAGPPAGFASDSSPESLPLTSPGSLTVTSEPPGSSVFLDGIYLGTTPLFLKDFPSGTHILQLDHPGYYDWKSAVTVPSGGKNAVKATLNPLAVSTVGSLAVSSLPGGAEVAVDGFPAGLTPDSGSLLLTNIPEGEHAITLTLGGYQPYAILATVTAGSSSTVSVNLHRSISADGNGALSVLSTPPGATVVVDDVFAGITPLIIPDVPSGSHTVTLHREGYTDYSGSFQVSTGATRVVSAVLERETPSPPPVPTRASGSFLPFVGIGALLVAGFLVIRNGYD